MFNLNYIFLITISYLLGSIPSGFIFTKFFSKKNILEIGWKKTSGSNVFKNVGFLPGVLTAISDVLKGSLVVFLAKKFLAPIEIQSLCGLFAVLGHNWSIFLKFAGGRGIATFFGAFLILSSEIIFLSLLPSLILALFLDTSIATIFLFLISLWISFKKGVLTSVGLLPLFSFPFILLKRLSPIKEISFKKPEIIRNRLLFDEDVFHSEWRIKRLKKKLTKKNFLLK